MSAPALEDVGLIMLKEQGLNKYNHLPPYALCDIAGDHYDVGRGCMACDLRGRDFSDLKFET